MVGLRNNSSFTPACPVGRAGRSNSFTLIELLIVVSIVAVLSIVVILVINPAQLLAQARDSNRYSDLDTINKALLLYEVDQSSLGPVSSTVIYVSLPDTSISTGTSTCSGIGLSSSNLPTGWSYQCASTSTYRNIDGTGWIPINLGGMATRSPIEKLPVDPINTTSSGNYYTFVSTSTNLNFIVTAASESQKMKNLSNTNTPLFPGLLSRGTNYSIHPLYNSQGLVGYWPMDEGSGSSTQDLSGNNNNGTATGTLPYFATGKVGPYAGSFDGNTNSINAGIGTSLEFSTSNFSIGLWFKPTSLCSTCNLLAHWGTNAGYSFSEVSGAPILFTKDGSDYRYGGNNSLVVGNWTYIVFTKSGTNLPNTYINGILNNGSSAGSGLTDIGTAGTSFYIGGTGGWYANKASGLIDDIRLYNRALSADEIKAIYNAEK